MKEILSPLSNGEVGAANLEKTLAGINHNLKIGSGFQTFKQITSLYKNKEILSFREWLQREEQKRKWTKDDSATAKSYIQGVFQTLGVTEEFLFCDINFLIRDIQRQLKSQPKLKGLWKQMLDWLNRSKKLGTKLIILDGQNRIKYALAPFRYDGLPISLRYNGQEQVNVKYEELDDFTKDQINNHLFRVSIIQGGDVTKVVDKLININDGEPWGDHERRDCRWTAVSFAIKQIASEPLVKKLHTKTIEDIWSGNYAIDKKGLTLFIAEFLHFLRNGDKGNAKSLTDMYFAQDENIERQLKVLNELFKFVAHNFPTSEASENFTKEIYRDLLIYISMMTNESDVNSSKNITHTFKFNQITDPKLLITRIIKKIKERLANKNDLVPFKRGGGELTHDEAYKLDKIKPNSVVWSKSNAKPGSFVAHHSGSSKNDIEARQKLFVEDLNKIIKQGLKDDILVEHDGRKITEFDRTLAEVNFNKSVIEGLIPDDYSVIGKELDHVIPVVKGGGANESNLEYIDKVDNRRKGAN